MAITPISSTALQGIQQGLQGVRRNAAEIVSANQTTTSFPTKDGIRALVELHQNAQLTATSLKALKVSDQMVGALLDIKA